MFSHIHDRLHERNIDLDDSVIIRLSDLYTCAAVVICKFETCKGQTHGDYRSRTESNGDLVILIIRDNYPCTIMYRRSNQPLTCNALRVNDVIDLS